MIGQLLGHESAAAVASDQVALELLLLKDSKLTAAALLTASAMSCAPQPGLVLSNLFTAPL